MIDFLSFARSLETEIVNRRRDFHRHPELGFQEHRSAQIVAQELQRLGIETKTGVAKTGVVGLLRGARPGRTVLLRFDMDALPVTEANTTDYASTNPGVMHACGHDGHMAIGLGVAKMLSAHRQEMAGTVKFIFQPAEEEGGGAKVMVEEGILEDPRPDVALALHLWNDLPVGNVIVGPGPVMASADKFTCTITGVPGHGALPQFSRDPIVAAAHVVVALQTIVSRNLDPLSHAVLSVGRLSAGQAFNVIPDKVEMSGTFRSFEPDVRQVILRRFEEIVTGVAATMGCKAEFAVEAFSPPVVNDPEVTPVVCQAIEEILGKGKTKMEQTMGSEDMAYILDKVPGCYFFVGAAGAGKEIYPHHSPRFDFDESALVVGAALISRAAAHYLFE